MAWDVDIFPLVCHASKLSTVCKRCNAMLLKDKRNMNNEHTVYRSISKTRGKKKEQKHIYSFSGVSDIGPLSCRYMTMAVFITAAFVDTVRNSSSCVNARVVSSNLWITGFGTLRQQTLSRPVVIGTHCPHSHLSLKC